MLLQIYRTVGISYCIVQFLAGRRGRENLRSMTKSTFQVSRDDTGVKFIHQAIDEMDKNHRESASSSVTEGIIYELPGELLDLNGF